MNTFPLGRKRAREILRRIVPRVNSAVSRTEIPSVNAVARRAKSPFMILVSTVISARTKDEVTSRSASRLFARANTPYALSMLDEETIASLIYPAGFYRMKARSIRALSRIIARDLGGRVPNTMEGLLALPGVGRKTANLVLTLGFGKNGICVDTHVHRISNRLGVICTDSPEKTEAALRAVLPVPLWKVINELFVRFGKSVCVPVSPRCSICPIARTCRRVGVRKHR